MNSSPDSGSLQRVVGVRALGLNLVNLTIGSAIFGLPALVAAMLGTAAVVAYLVCAVLFGLVGLCFAEAGSRVGSAGGLYAYATTSFGPVAGGVAGTLLWVASGASADAAIANLLLDTLGTVQPVLTEPWIRATFLILLFAIVAAVNIRGVHYGVRLSMLITLIKIAPLVLLVIAGAFFVDPTRLAWTGMPSIQSVGEASVLVFYAFMGLEAALSMSGEIKRPSRTVPRGILMGLLIIATLYIGLQLVSQGTLGEALKDSKAPLLDAAKIVLGPWGGALLIATVALSASGCIAADVLSTPRVLFAFAEQGQLPRRVAAVHPRFATPAIAIAVYSIVCTALAVSGSFRQLAIVSSSGTLILYMICCLGVLRLRARKVMHDAETFVAPGGPVVPLLAAGIIAYLLSSLSWQEIAAAFAFVAVTALAFYIVQRRRRAQ